MSAPRVALSAVVRRWEDADRATVNAAYVHSVANAGGIPLILSQIMGPGLAARALDGCDALLLSGGEDVDPAHYGAPPSPALRSPDPARDAFELALFRTARERGLPVLGICRGIQLINVALGGTLWQDLPSERPGPVYHDSPVARTARTHEVRLAPGSRAARALGAQTLIPNSFHHQGIRDLAPGLVATGWAADGLIEVAESADGDAWLLAVQWHPEEMHAEPGSPEQGLFRALVQEAKRYSLSASRSARERRSTTSPERSSAGK
ncbi:MAG TPA: gamma-glutamyl-gamma-aminobutyrate hydrolase family protein [Gemmatimonadales bacterium]|nr:gamma-glutamyl-gamma-aminobutyrate hydrolase family protein [Gemmatimonadales bacterium]